MTERARPSLPALWLALSLAACGAPPPEADPDTNPAAPAAASMAPAPASAPGPAPEPAPRWQTAASGEGDALFLAGAGEARRITLFCPAETEDLIVNVPGFRPVASEERMSFGAGGTAVTLVADPRGDSGRGGVTGRGRLPDELAAILSGPEGLSVSYGAQASGPHAAPGPEAARLFLRGCRD
jgi:hypothetical protein